MKRDVKEFLALSGLFIATCLVVGAVKLNERGFVMGLQSATSLAVQNPTSNLFFRQIGPQLTSEQSATARKYNDALLVIKQPG